MRDKMKNVDHWIHTSQQTGGGAYDGSHEGDIEDDSSITNSEQSESEDESSSNESTEEANYVCEGDDENWVFNRILLDTENEIGNNNPDSHERLCKLFRLKYIEYLVWIHHLRKNSIHKKVMTTAKDLEDGDGDYDRIEALKAAVNQRQFLLDELVPEPDSEAGGAADDADDGNETEDTE